MTILVASLLAGCSNDALLKANQQQLQTQQGELEQLKQDVSALQTTQHPSYNYTLPPPGSCDDNIRRQATRKGSERFAANDFGTALTYYQDALTACPKSAQADLNLARAYEAVGDRTKAMAYYRAAAKDGASGRDEQAVRDANAALSRLGG